MAYQSSPVLDFSFTAAEDLSSYQYRAVKINTSGEVRLLDSSAEKADGVLQNAPASGEEATVRMLGITKMEANAAIDEGVQIMSEFVSGTDCGKADNAVGNKDLVLGIVVDSSDAEDDLVSVFLTPHVGTIDFILSNLNRATTITSITCTGATTLTAAQMITRFLKIDCGGANRVVTSSTAALLVAAIEGARIGDSFEIAIKNTSDANETITVAGGAGVTLTGTLIPVNTTKIYKVILTSLTAVTMDEIGSIDHNGIATKANFAVASSVVTAGAGTYTAAHIIGKLIERDCTGDNRTDTTATATQILAAIPGAVVGTSFEFDVRNISDPTTETITVAGGSGVTMQAKNTNTIAGASTRRFRGIVTDIGTPAITVYSLGTSVH